MKKSPKTSLPESLKICKESMDFFFELSKKEFDLAQKALDRKDDYGFTRHSREHGHLTQRFTRERKRLEKLMGGQK